METYPANFGKEGFGAFYFYALGKAKAFPHALFLKPGMARLCFLFNSSKKVLKGSVEIFEALLQYLAMDLSEPLSLRLFFECCEFVILVKIAGAFTICFKSFFSLIEASIKDPSFGSGKLQEHFLLGPCGF